MYIDEGKYKRGDKFCARALIRRSYREGGKIKHHTIAVRVFEGNTGDSAACLVQIRVLANQFGVKEVTLVGDWA